MIPDPGSRVASVSGGESLLFRSCEASVSLQSIRRFPRWSNRPRLPLAPFQHLMLFDFLIFAIPMNMHLTGVSICIFLSVDEVEYHFYVS